MGRWKTTIRKLSAEVRLHFHARSLSRRTSSRFRPLALYSMVAVIAVIVFSALSAHPF